MQGYRRCARDHSELQQEHGHRCHGPVTARVVSATSCLEARVTGSLGPWAALPHTDAHNSANAPCVEPATCRQQCSHFPT